MTTFSASTLRNIVTGMYLHCNEYPFELQSPTFKNQGLITINFELPIQIVLLTVSFSFWEQACTGEPPFVDPIKHGITSSARNVLQSSSYQHRSSSNLILAWFSFKPEVCTDLTKNRLAFHTNQQTL
jgi:hypothetical protein